MSSRRALLGRTGLRLLDSGAQPLPAFHAIGIVMLMLSVGTHVELSSEQLRQNLSRGGLALLVSVVAGLLVGQAISRDLGIDHALLFGVLFAGSSAAVVFPCIEERALSGSGIAFLTAWVVLADGLTVLLMPLTLVGPSHLLLALVGDALIIAAGAAILWLAQRAIRHETVSAGMREAFRESRQRSWALQFRLGPSGPPAHAGPGGYRCCDECFDDDMGSILPRNGASIQPGRFILINPTRLM